MCMCMFVCIHSVGDRVSTDDRYECVYVYVYVHVYVYLYVYTQWRHKSAK